MGRIIVALCLGLVSGLGGCYSPPHPECGFVCGTSGQCPADYTCSNTDNICHLNGSSPTMICAVDAFTGHEEPPPEGVGFHVTAITPTAGSLMVPRNEQILVEFDRSANGNTLNTSTFLVSSNSVAVPGTVVYIDATHTVQFNPSPTYPSGAVVLVGLTSSVQSSVGEQLAPYSFSFTTVDDVPPTFVTSTPLDLAMNVPVTTTIVVMFSEAVTNVSGTTFVVTQGATTLPGTYASADAITWTMTPTANLPAASVITVSLGAGITDLAGNPFAPLQFTFTTQ